MLLGVTLLRKKYPLAKYLCVLLIVTGVALFMYKPKKGAGGDDHIFGYGELLLVSAARVQITPRLCCGRSEEGRAATAGILPRCVCSSHTLKLV